MSKPNDDLDAVYALKTPDDNRRHYDGWAASYDSDFVREMRIDDDGQRLLALERLVIVGEQARAVNFLVAMPLAALGEDIAAKSPCTQISGNRCQ